MRVMFFGFLVLSYSTMRIKRQFILLSIFFLPSFFVSSHLLAQAPGGVADSLHSWWRADSGVIASPVTSWADQSANSFDLTSTNGPTRIVADIN